MTIIEKVVYYQRVWAALIPHLPVPTPPDAGRWSVYPDEAVDGAILRAAKKFAQYKISADFDPKQAYRYTTATARSIAQRAAVLATDQEIGAVEK